MENKNVPHCFRIIRTRILSLVGLALAAGSTAKADFAYIGYYNSQTVTQLTVGSGSNTTITGATNFAGSSGSGYAPEAIMSVTGLPGAHSSEVLVVNNTAGTVEAYTTPTTANPTSTLISSNILKTSDGTASYSLASTCTWQRPIPTPRPASSRAFMSSAPSLASWSLPSPSTTPTT
jgi:hypothetical protein